MQKVNLYKQHNAPLQLAMASTGKIINNPMYNREIQLYKGIRNPLELSIKTQDRKAISLQDKTLFMYISKLDGSAKWVKELFPTDIKWGSYEVVFEREDLEELDAGFYNAYFLAVNDEGEEEILYTGENWETKFELEIIEGVYDTFVPSKEIKLDDWTLNKVRTEDGKSYETYISSAIKANNSPNQGFAFTTNEFTGRIDILGTNDVEPDVELRNWYIIDTLDLTESSETIGKFYTVACTYIKFKTNTMTGLNKILYRN